MPDSQPVDRATIVNWALTDLGQKAEFQLDAQTSLGGIVARVWPRCRDHCFMLADWSFCRRTTKLMRQSATPENGWRYGFALPGDRLGEPLKVMRTIVRSKGEPLRDFDIEGDTLYADEPDVWARCKVEVDPESWDPGFRTCFVTALAGFLAVPILQDTGLRDEHLEKAFGPPSQGGAGGMFGRVIAQHLAGKPIGRPLLDGDPLSTSRW